MDLYKLKEKVLIGYVASDGDDVTSKRAALRMYNSHLHRIEVVSYDQLVAICRNVIEANAGESGEESDGDSDALAF